MTVMREVPLGLPILAGSEKILGIFPYFKDHKDSNGKVGYYRYGSFKNYDDIILVWGHDPKKVVASQREGNLKIWEQDACLNFHITRGRTDWNAFAFRTLRYPKGQLYGLSPSGDLYEHDKKFGGVNEHSGITLIEFSITDRPVNSDSIVAYYAEVDMAELKRHPGPKGRGLLKSTPKYVSTLPQSEIDRIKATSPYFKRAEIRGFETTAFGV